jgi:hypothetical protein
MLHTSMTAIEFQDQYRTEDDCLEALFKLRWPHGFICPNCEHDDAYKLSCGLYQCAVCRHQASVTSGTIFHGTKIPLRKWFWIIFEVAHDKGGASSSRLAVQLGMYQKTVWHILQKIRHAMGCRDQHVSLAGLIELDEAIIGKHARKTGRLKKTKEGESASYKQGKLTLGARKRKGGKPKTQTPVLVLVEAGNFSAGNVFLQVVEKSTYETITEVVSEHVDEGDHHFKTDGAQSNYAVRYLGHHLDARVCSGPLSLEHLPILNQVVGLLKRMLFGTYHGVSARYLPRYVQEFAFRFNRRENETTIFESTLRACLFSVQMTYAESKL